ncbi:MAG TPA: hypothetical protein DGL25_03750, partial [Dehalococcoidia bacterium]|nr:hypothetical protein [Dehalococcoidia bacterium]
MTASTPIFLLTDFGNQDTYVGQVKAVLSTRAPGVPLFSLTHEVSPFAIDEGAWLLETALPFLPVPAVVLAVVDPGVGSERLPIAVRAPVSADPTAVRYFVGPDNGLLSSVVGSLARPSKSEVSPVPPAIDVREIQKERVGVALESISATFEGRDVFAPAAASIAVGNDFKTLGPRCKELTLLPPFAGTYEGGSLSGSVVHIDRYGNLITTIRREQLPIDFRIEIRDHCIERMVRTFSDVAIGALACHVD